jgi:hypothetical protein
MPLFYKKTWWGANQLYIPELIKSAGIYSVHVMSKPRVGHFLKSIPTPLGRGKMLLAEGTPWTEDPVWKQETKNTWIYAPQDTYEALANNYSAAFLRRLDTANQADFFPAATSKPETLAQFWKKHAQGKNNQSPDVHTLQRIQYQIAHRGWGSPMAAQDGDGNLLAFYYVGYTPGRISLLLSASSEKGRQLEAPAFLLDQLIQRHAGTPAVMDFLVSGSTHSDLMAQLFREINGTVGRSFSG